MKTALRLLLAPYRFSVDRLFRMGEVGWAHWFDDPNTLYRRRNRLTYSRDFTNAVWDRTRILSVTADADGVGDLVVPEATPSSHAIEQAAAVTVGVTTTYVVRAKSGGYDFVVLSLGSSSFAFFDVSAGTVGTTMNAISASIAAAADAPGYYDCTLVAIPNSAHCFVYVVQTDGVFYLTGDGTSGIYFARAQLETYTTTASEYQDVPTTWEQAYLDAVGAERIFSWQDSAGTTPVTAVGQSVGLILDRAYGGMRGASLSAPTASLAGGATNNGDGTFTIPASGSIRFDYTLAQLSNGMLYEFEIERVGVASTGTVTVDWCDGPQSTLTAASAGTKAYHRGARATYDATYRFLDVVAGGSSSITFRINFARSVPGTHLIQATGTAKPTLSARVNQLIQTESLGGSAWVDSGATVGAAIADPNGNSTAVAYTRATSQGDARYQPVSCGAGVNVIYARIKAGTSPTSLIYVLDSTAVAARLSVGVTWTGGVPSVNATVGSATTPVSVGGGWYALTMQTTSAVVATNANRLYFYPARAGSVNGDTAYMWGADLRTADDAAKNLPAYQRVGATAADHDTDGFPHAAYPDGTDDFDTTSTGGGGTSGFFFCGVLTVSGGAGTARTIWSDTGTNTGYRVRINASNKLELAAGNGSAYTTVESNETITAPGTYLLSAWDDGGVLAVQVGNAAAATTARPAVSAGTSTITSYRDNGAATSYFNGRDYGSVYRQSYPGETAHNRLKQWQARRAGITV